MTIDGDNLPKGDPSASRRIVVQLATQGGNEAPERAVKAIQDDKFGPWSDMVKEFPDLVVRPRWQARSTKDIRELIAKAQELDPDYKPGPILSYVEIVCPPNVDANKVLESLTGWNAVRKAWIAPDPTPPPVAPNDDPRWPNQGYLDPAPNGIDAEFAWTVAGGDGAGQGFVDIEWGWTLNHQDLAAHGITLLSGLNNGWSGHGTAVLGEVAAVDNALGCVGITPELASVSVIGQWRTSTDYDTADAVLDACSQMDFGHVLLLEAHNDFNGFTLVPVEAYDDTYEMIRLATALGIIVVEAAGNGGEDLDLVTNTVGDNFFDPTDATFRDSGAIIVGAATSAAPHARLGFSSFGGRVDCYGWGQNVDTTGDGGTGTSTTAYTGFFSGTSSASPIIAGAALAVQGIAENSGLGIRFSPLQMRTILTEPTTSTPSANPATDRIGVMPNLRAIIEDDEINQLPDVYIRDFVGDVGDPHNNASISSSPDVILVPTAVGNPTAAFGPGSGTENSSTLGHEAIAGQDNFIYVRSLNRGGVAGANTTAEIFWSPASTLVTPDLWTSVGTVTFPNLPTGDVLTVSDALTWPSGDIPAQGHYCFVAILDHADDPGPNPVDFLNWGNFTSFIRENNNVAWRNFNVVPTAPPSAGLSALPFLMAGAFDRPREMRLEAVMRLPKGAKAMLRVPEHLIQHFRCGRSPFFKQDRKTKSMLVPINPQGRTRFCDVTFPAKVRHELELLVSIPKEAQDQSYRGWVAQFEGKQELGRVTWNFTSPEELAKRDAHLKEFAKR